MVQHPGMVHQTGIVNHTGMVNHTGVVSETEPLNGEYLAPLGCRPCSRRRETRLASMFVRAKVSASTLLPMGLRAPMMAAVKASHVLQS